MQNTACNEHTVLSTDQNNDKVGYGNMISIPLPKGVAEKESPIDIANKTLKKSLRPPSCGHA